MGRLSGRESRLWKGICGIFARRRTDLIPALVMTAALFVPAALRFDFYYDLNDDVLIKDVLSGVYSGSPDGHTMQLLYPLGLFLSLLYRILSIPVFGVFLVLCQYGSIFIIAYRILQQCRKWQAKLLALAAQGAFWAAAFGMHLVFVQYTVTAGMLASAAIFWVMTAPLGMPGQTETIAPGQRDGGVAGQPDAGTPGRRAAGGPGQMRTAVAGKGNASQKRDKRRAASAFLRENLPALALYWLAFCLRPEMALLLLPLAGVAGICRWGQEASFFTGENFCKYLTTFGVLVLGLVICLGLDSLAYRENGWPAFRQFFDERTELYDYQKDFIDNYEENAASYEEAGVTRQQHAMLANYNFGVDDRIDETLLASLKEKAVGRTDAGGFFRKSFREGLWSLVLGHWTGKGDMPFNLVFLLCSALALGLGLTKGRRHLLWQMPLCLVGGGALWMFLLLRDRPVDRVLHPLYLGQTVVLAGLLLLEMRRTEPKKEGVVAGAGACVLTLCMCLPCIFVTYAAVSGEYARREEENRTNEAVMAYCSAHPGRLFLEDVYSTVSYSEKISVDRDKPFNYDLLGGWLVKSPLTKEKLSAFGYSTMGEAVQAGGSVCLLSEAGSDMQWLNDYFKQEGIAARAVKTGTVTEGVETYQVIRTDGGESLTD